MINRKFEFLELFDLITKRINAAIHIHNTIYIDSYPQNFESVTTGNIMAGNHSDQQTGFTLKNWFSDLCVGFLRAIAMLIVAFVIGSAVTAGILAYCGLPMIFCFVGGIVATGIVIACLSTSIFDLF